MKVAMAAGATAYSMRTAMPVAKPPSGPRARRANPYPAPAVGSVEDISARPNTMHVYMMPMRMKAMSRPPHPPSASPRFQPEKSPEMT
jgi:hypothetical protein